MYAHRGGERPTLKRPNTIRFQARNLNITSEEVYVAIHRELNSVSTTKCIAPLENGWFNVTFDNDIHSGKIAMQGIKLQGMLIQCESANVRNSAVVYIKVPYEMSDEVVTTALLPYGTVVNIRRQMHDFDNEIETGVRSVLVKNMKKAIPSYVKVGGFTLPIRYKGQQRTCKICNQPGHIARNCELRGRCFVCGSHEHRAGWHERQREKEESDTPSSVSIQEERGKYDDPYDTNTDEEEENTQSIEKTQAETIDEEEDEDIHDNEGKRNNESEKSEDKKQKAHETTVQSTTTPEDMTSNNTRNGQTTTPLTTSTTMTSQPAKTTQSESDMQTGQEDDNVQPSNTTGAETDKNNHQSEPQEDNVSEDVMVHDGEEEGEEGETHWVTKVGKKTRKKRGSGTTTQQNRPSPYELPKSRGRGRGKRDI